MQQGMPPGAGMRQPEAEQHVMKGSVLDRRRKKEGAGLSASAGYAKKMAEMAAAQYNSERAAAAAQEDEGEQDPITGEISPRIPQVCNEAYNLNPILRENILASEYFKTLAEISTFDELVDEIYNKVTYATPFIPNTRSPSSCFCLLYRCFQMRLTYKQLATMLDHADSPYIPAVGLLYVRYVVDPKEAWGFYNPKVRDETEFDPGATGKKKTISQFVNDLIEDLHYHDTILPRIPVLVQRQMQENILRLEYERKEHAEKRRFIKVGMKVQAKFYEDEETYEAEILAETKLGVNLVFTEYGNEQDTDLADITLPEKSDKGGDDRKRDRSRDRSRGREDRSSGPRDYREGRERDRSRDRDRDRDRDRRDRDRRRSRSRSRSRDRPKKDAPPVDFRAEVLKRQADSAASKGGDYARRPTSYKSSLSSASNRRC